MIRPRPAAGDRALPRHAEESGEVEGARSAATAHDAEERSRRRRAWSIQNAFTAARAADGRSYQKPISRYEHRPTSSQKTNI